MRYSTQKSGEHVPVNPKTETTEWDRDCPGLGVRTRGSLRTWIVQWRVNGKTKKRTLGRYEEITRDKARGLAVTLLKASSARIDGDFVSTDGGNSNPTVGAFGERYLRDCAARWKPATLRAHRHCVTALISVDLGGVKLGDVTRDDVVTWMRRLPCSPSTTNRALAVLSGIMRHAELLGLRAPGSNPCAGLRRRKSSFKATYLNPAEWAHLGAALQSEQMQSPRAVGCLRFMALTGCRRGEALGLRWEVLDGARVALPDSKTGPRAIWLGAAALSLLASFPRTNLHIFGLGDRPLKASTLERVWGRVRTSAGLPTLRMHDLRHNFASVAVAEGIDLKVVGTLLGHTDLSTTEGYAHLEPPSIKAASQRVGAHLMQVAGPKQTAPKQTPKKERAPSDSSLYQRFARSKLGISEFALAHGLEVESFRCGLIAWRASLRSGGDRS